VAHCAPGLSNIHQLLSDSLCFAPAQLTQPSPRQPPTLPENSSPFPVTGDGLCDVVSGYCSSSFRSNSQPQKPRSIRAVSSLLWLSHEPNFVEEFDFGAVEEKRSFLKWVFENAKKPCAVLCSLHGFIKWKSMLAHS